MDGATAPLAREQRFSQAIGKAGFAEEERAGRRAAAGIEERRNDLAAEVREQRRVAIVAQRHNVTQAHVPAVAVVRVVAREQVHERIDGDVVNVAQAAGDDFQLRAVGPHAGDAAAAKLQFAAILAGRLDEAVIADRDVDPAVDTHANAVRGVIGAAKLQIEADPLTSTSERSATRRRRHRGTRTGTADGGRRASCDRR